MNKKKLGIIREGKIPIDRRVPFAPDQVSEIIRKYPNVNVVCQHSSIRCFNDKEYIKRGVPVIHNVNDCDILMGIKEVPVSNLIEGKTYLFFSHTMKEQPHNRALLQEILRKKITLIDYEALTDGQGNRLVAFGKYAGIVGTYNCLWMYGKRYKRYELRRAMDCLDYDDLKSELSKVILPPLKVVLTGSGRVGKGAEEVLKGIGMEKVSVYDFLNKNFSHAVYVQLNSVDYHKSKNGKPFDRKEFHNNPENYQSDFVKFARAADILINGAYWNPDAPRLFSKEDMTKASFKIKVIADISCDIDGSVPATIKATDVNNPVYDYDPFSQQAVAPFSDERFISVMAVDNLPCELPRSSSAEFGRGLIDSVLDSLLIADDKEIIARATITRDGSLTGNFSYLKNYVQRLS